MRCGGALIRVAFRAALIKVLLSSSTSRVHGKMILDSNHQTVIWLVPQEAILLLPVSDAQCIKPWSCSGIPVSGFLPSHSFLLTLLDFHLGTPVTEILRSFTLPKIPKQQKYAHEEKYPCQLQRLLLPGLKLENQLPLHFMERIVITFRTSEISLFHLGSFLIQQNPIFSFVIMHYHCTL